MRLAALVALALLACTGTPEPPTEAEAPIAHADARAQKAPVRIREIAPAGVMPRRVDVRLAEDAFTEGAIGGPPPSGTEVRIEPAVPGQVEVTAVNGLSFVPDAGFAPDTSYTFTLVEVADEPAGAVRTFRTPPFRLVRTALRERDPEANRVVVELVFSGPVDPASAAEHARFTLGGEAVRPTTSRAGDHDNEVRFTFGGRGLFQDGDLAVTLAEGVPMAGFDVRAPAGEGTVALKAPAAWEVRTVRVQEGASGHYVDVVCHDGAGGGERHYWDRETWDDYWVSERCLLDAQDARHGLRVVPEVELTVAAGPAGFRIFGDFERGTYTLQVDAGTRTVDGGMLAETFETELTIPERSPKVAFATKGRYLPRDAWEDLAIRHVNVQGAEVTVRHVPEQNLVFWMGGEEPLTERTSNVVARRTVALPNQPDAEVTSWIDLAALLPEARRGVYEVEVRGVLPETEEDTDAAEVLDTGWQPPEPAEAQGPVDRARILLTDLQLVAKLAAPAPDAKWTPEVHVWAIGMADLAPVGGVEIDLVRPSGKTMGSCSTGSDGGCTIEVAGDPVDEAAPFALIARKGGDLTYLKFSDLEVPVPADVQGLPYLDEQPYRAAIQTDRGVYRPGDTAHLTAILRDPAHLAPRAPLPVVVKVFDPRRKELRRKVIETNPAGLVATDIPFADFATTGSYRVTVEVADRVVGEETFAVEEFVPERMKVEATVQGAHLASDPVPVEVEARWLFGGTAAGSEFELTCHLEPGAFVPEKSRTFHFGLATVEDGVERRSTTLGTLTGELGEEGRATSSCPPAAQSGGFLGAATLVAQAAVFEGESGRTTLGEARAPVHPERFYVGLQSATAKAKAGQPVEVTGLVVDWDGELAPSEIERVELSLVRLEEEYVYTYDSREDRYRYRRMLRRAQEDAVEVPVEGGRFRTTLTPAGDGAGYLVVARAGQALSELYVEGSGRRYWWGPSETSVDQTPRPGKPGELDLAAPELVRVGERFTVTTTAPYGGRILFTAETHGVLASHWEEVDAGPVEWSFELDAFVPNVYVSALLVKDPHLESDGAFLPDRAFGVRSVRVEPVDFSQPVTLTVPEEVRPHARLDVGIDLGRLEAPTFVTVAAVDEGILSLTDFQSPDPLKEIFARRQLGVETFETVGWTLLVPPGGPSSRTGGDADQGVGRVQMVKPVALWSGVVEVPESGRTTVSFEVPSYRGELRVMAVAAGARRAGSASAQVTVRDPLVLQTTLPRFLVEGDEAVLPVFVANVSGAAREVVVELTTEDLPLPGEEIAERVAAPAAPVEVLGDRQARLSLEDGASGTVLFRVRATNAPDAARFRVTAKADGLESWEALELPVMPAESEVRLTERVRLVRGANDLGPALRGWVPGSDRTRIWVTTNPHAEALSHLRYLVRYPYGCVEQTTSSTRPLLYVSDLVEAVDPALAAESPVAEMVAHGIDRVLSMQTPGGGFGYWPGAHQPSPWGTVYATHMLLDAREAGYQVPERPLEDALAYLEREVDARHDADDTVAYMHYVLARAGRARVAQAEKLLADVEGRRTRSSYHAVGEPQYLLMAAMYLGGDRRHEAELRRPDTRDLTNERRNDWTFWSDLRSRGFQLAVYHDLFGASGAEGEALAALVGNGLARHRSAWYTTQELSWGITGLGKWVSGARERVPEPTLTVGGREVEAEEVDGGYVWTLSGATAAGTVAVDLPRADLPVYAVVSTEGLRVEGAPVGGQGLTVARQLLDGKGQPLDLSRHALGDAVYVKVTLHNRTDDTVQNIALVDRVPAGWEVENPRLGRATMPDWADPRAMWAVDHMNLRDDRVEVFGALEGGARRTVLYQVRAVTGGAFTWPAVSAEAMYDPRIWARSPRSHVEVKDPWSGT